MRNKCNRLREITEISFDASSHELNLNNSEYINHLQKRKKNS